MCPTVTLHGVRDPLRRSVVRLSAPGSYVLGRANDCDARVPAAGDTRLVSRRHCQLEITESGVFVHDLGSRNGTFVNGTNIGKRPADRAAGETPDVGPGYPLADGDELRLGFEVVRVAIAPRLDGDTSIHRLPVGAC
jgi:pSer/pThr/pTyr-binding forkhead associated (FHA) protein